MAAVRSKRGYLYLDYHDEASKRHEDALFLRENRKELKLELYLLKLSMLQIPEPKEAMKRKTKQYKTASSPLF